jgi:molybdate transport system ATP-binding protein
MSGSWLRADVRVARSDVEIAADLSVERGEVAALVGPNGAGKSTVVRAIAGLLPEADADVTVAGTRWQTGRRINVPTHRRCLGLLTQDPLLFPHLSVHDNVAFGVRRRGASRAEARRTATDWLDRVDLASMGDRKPEELSGGQRQRAAIARALATSPDLLLLDEPLAALDVGAAQQIRSLLRERLAEFGGATVLVTHDPIDALTLADRLVVMESGAVTQTGAPWEVATHPRTPHAARLVGLNVLSGHGEGNEVVLDGGHRVATTALCVGPTHLTLAPSAITLTVEAPQGSARNRWHGQVRSVAPLGRVVRVELDVGFPLIADVTPGSAAELALARGLSVWASAKATEVRVLEQSNDTIAPIG